MKELTIIELGRVSGAGSVFLKEIEEYAKHVIEDIPYAIRPAWPIIPPYLEPVCDN
ncbi:hypothetical protein [Xenorhabdus cabanillasii]|uniref:Uncharacterized protein n=1 Tax=Xenorhabdus cabanillasii JM26 TaxID=1427517 RepID=W1IZ78_9GAMM|nr:hypothetical protein [Xenorhabdus cabanillasii]PHM77424.1 hypothetical protein Xcab_01996 [Xenorhabdus cabanillasii JM26]CDL83138.1 hypothetical protein XCR1_180008 [Xenorhabdus cabanillasii JM26]